MRRVRPPHNADGSRASYQAPTSLETIRGMTIREVLKKIRSSLKSARPKYLGLRGRGQEWEAVAERHLKRAGYIIRARNVRSIVGEIDLIAEEKGVLCFVEVK